ncbi:hypothetical protein HZS_2658 [Henneguya salminicola]|nr:hypothetical protein HZS_2658 [Henneguya salminicola]
MTELLCYNGFKYHKNLSISKKKYLKCSNYNVDKCPVFFIIFSKNIQVKGKHICVRNKSAATRIADNNITPKMLIENYIEIISAKKNLYPHDIHQNIVINPRHAIKRTGSLFSRQLWLSPIHSQYHTMLICATNETLAILRYDSHTFIDSTFRCTHIPSCSA